MTIAEMLEESGKKQGMLLGMEKGMEKGREEGREEERYLLAKKMLEMRLATVEAIAQLTGFSLKKIKEIQAQIGTVQ